VAELRSADRGFRLWDVANSEAHVRATLDATLKAAGARLNGAQYERAFAFLLAKCWELSGVEGDGTTLRYVYELHGFLVPRRLGEEFEPIKLPQFPQRETAELVLEELQRRRRVSFPRVERVRPRGAYDPGRGLSFSTYSRRILSQRVWDWYRSDPEFGDSRYESRREHEESLEALAGRRRADEDQDGSFLERHGPGARLDSLDELNLPAYRIEFEEVLTIAAIGR
jgi:hypothetical protein